MQPIFDKVRDSANERNYKENNSFSLNFRVQPMFGGARENTKNKKFHNCLAVSKNCSNFAPAKSLKLFLLSS